MAVKKKSKWRWWLLAIIILVILNVLVDHFFLQRQH